MTWQSPERPPVRTTAWAVFGIIGLTVGTAVILAGLIAVGVILYFAVGLMAWGNNK